ncbi:MAG: hypothetical protein ABIL39_09550 [candidate division WOR-3 bacterium]
MGPTDSEYHEYRIWHIELPLGLPIINTLGFSYSTPDKAALILGTGAKIIKSDDGLDYTFLLSISE